MLDGSWLTAFPGQKAKEEKTPKYSRHKATTKSRGPYENLTTYSQTTGPAHCATSFLFFFLAISARAARFAHLTRILHWLSLLPAILEARPTELVFPFRGLPGSLANFMYQADYFYPVPYALATHHHRHRECCINCF